MGETQGITRLGFRLVLDSLEDSIGTNGRNAILNYAKLEQYIKTPPEYDPDQRITTEEYQRLWTGVREILGNKGYNPIGYRAGKTAVKDAQKRNAGYRTMIESPQDPVEKLVSLASAYLYMGNMNPDELLEHLPEENVLIMHRPECNECIEICKNKEITKDITRPGCAMIVGALTELSNVRPDLLTGTVEETRCKLMGAPECTFKITYAVT
jgi:predicted hydrocarbon binding protein